MAAQKLPTERLTKLAAASGQVFGDLTQWQAALKGWGITKERHVRVATVGALLGSLLDHGFNRDLAIVSDDAGQFNILLHALCWIHAERLLAKLIGFTDSQRQALEQIRSEVWQYYRDLKAYRVEPTPNVKLALETRFDTLCTTHTCFTSLNLALKRMLLNKRELLLTLDRPDLPLHNNLSEGDIREYVKRRKISGGTRSDEGRRCRDTFASLKKTCRKLGVSLLSLFTLMGPPDFQGHGSRGTCEATSGEGGSYGSWRREDFRSAFGSWPVRPGPVKGPRHEGSVRFSVAENVGGGGL